MKERYLKRGDEHIKIEQLQEIKNRYDIYMSNTILPVLKIDTTKYGWFGKIRRFIEQ